MDRDCLAFTIHVIHELARAWHMLPSGVFRILKRTGCLDEYIIPCHDVLHTLGARTLVDDMSAYVRRRGVRV